MLDMLYHMPTCRLAEACVVCAIFLVICIPAVLPAQSVSGTARCAKHSYCIWQHPVRFEGDLRSRQSQSVAQHLQPLPCLFQLLCLRSGSIVTVHSHRVSKVSGRCIEVVQPSAPTTCQ